METTPWQTLKLNATDLTGLADGFTGITVGDAAAGTGFVYVKNATFTDPVNIVGGQIRVGGLNAGSSNNVTLTARLLGILVHAGSPRDITGNTIVLTANGDIADGGNSLIVNATSGVTTNSSSANGNQYLSTATSVSVISFNAGAGTVMLSGGTFGLSGSDVIHNNTRLNVNGASLDLNSYTDTVAGVTLSQGEIKDSGATKGKLISNSAFAVQNGTISAILDGGVGLTKTSAGTVALSGANTYTGATAIRTGSWRQLDQERERWCQCPAAPTTVANGTITLARRPPRARWCTRAVATRRIASSTWPAPRAVARLTSPGRAC